MKVAKTDPTKRAPDEGALFLGEVKRLPLVQEGAHRMVEVTFKAGAKTKLHTHGSDQLLIISSGSGIVGTKDEKWDVVTGDAIYIPAQEPHFHGAAPGTDMAHYSILGPEGGLKILED